MNKFEFFPNLSPRNQQIVEDRWKICAAVKINQVMGVLRNLHGNWQHTMHVWFNVKIIDIVITVPA